MLNTCAFLLFAHSTSCGRCGKLELHRSCFDLICSKIIKHGTSGKEKLKEHANHLGLVVGEVFKKPRAEQCGELA